MLLTKAIQQLTSFWSVVGLSGGKREGDSRSSIRGNHMNLGGPAAAGFAAGDGDEGSLGRRPYAAERYAGDRRTTVKDRKKEIGKGLLNKMLADLGIDREEFRGTE